MRGDDIFTSGTSTDAFRGDDIFTSGTSDRS